MLLENSKSCEDRVEHSFFDKGKLYIRRNSGKHGVEEVLHFEMLDHTWHMKNVATFRDGIAEPSHGTWQEVVHKQCAITGSGNKVEHLPATDKDLKRFMRAYKSPFLPLQKWINKTCNISDLDEKEKARLRKIAKEVEAEKQQS